MIFVPETILDKALAILDIRCFSRIISESTLCPKNRENDQKRVYNLTYKNLIKKVKRKIPFLLKNIPIPDHCPDFYTQCTSKCGFLGQRFGSKMILGKLRISLIFKVFSRIIFGAKTKLKNTHFEVHWVYKMRSSEILGLASLYHQHYKESDDSALATTQHAFQKSRDVYVSHILHHLSAL